MLLFEGKFLLDKNGRGEMRSMSCDGGDSSTYRYFGYLLFAVLKPGNERYFNA